MIVIAKNRDAQVPLALVCADNPVYENRPMKTNQPPTVAAVLNRVRAFINQERLSLAEVARRAGINESTIRHLWDDDWRPSTRTLELIEAIIPPTFKAPAPEPAPQSEQFTKGSNANGETIDRGTEGNAKAEGGDRAAAC